MLVQVHTDNHIVGRQEVLDQVEAAVRASLAGFEDQLTRLEVYLNDQNGPKATGDDIKCTVETHPTGGKRLVAHHNAGDMFAAVDGAVDKLHRMLAEHVDRHHNGKGRTPMGGVPLGEGGSGGDSQGRTSGDGS